MGVVESRPGPELLTTGRLVLEPLRVEHAEEMAPLLDDLRLHTYTGGQPVTLEQLRTRYARQVVGSSDDGSERWLNWVVRRADTAMAVGTVQATVATRDDETVAAVAWVFASAHQRQGYAREAGAAMVGWLRREGVDRVTADIHPDHHASMGVARALGLRATGTVVDGEIRWEG